MVYRYLNQEKWANLNWSTTSFLMFMQTCLISLLKECLPTGNYWMLLDVLVGYVQEVQKNPDIKFGNKKFKYLDIISL